MTVGEILALLKLDVSDWVSNLSKAQAKMAESTSAIQASAKLMESAIAGAFGSDNVVAAATAMYSAIATGAEGAAKRVKVAFDGAAASMEDAIAKATAISQSPQNLAGVYGGGTVGGVAGRGGPVGPALGMEDAIAAAMGGGPDVLQLIAQQKVDQYLKNVGSFSLVDIAAQVKPVDALRSGGALAPVDARAIATVAAQTKNFQRDLEAIIDPAKLQTGAAASGKALLGISQALSVVDEKMSGSRRAFGAMEDAIWGNRNAAFNLGMGLSSLSELFGRGAQQMTTTGIIALGLTPAMAGLVMSIVGGATALTGYVLALKDAVTEQSQMNLAVRAFDMSAVASQIKATQLLVEEFNEGERRGGIAGVIARLTRFGEEVRSAVGGRDVSPKFVAKHQEMIVPMALVQEGKALAQIDAAYQAALASMAKFDASAAFRANNVNEAAAAFKREQDALDKRTEAVLAATDAEYRFQKAKKKQEFLDLGSYNTPGAKQVLDAMETVHQKERDEILAQRTAQRREAEFSQLTQQLQVSARIVEENARVAESYSAAQVAAAKFNESIALEAANYGDAERYHRAELDVLARERDVKIGAVVAAAQPGIEVAKLYGNDDEVARRLRNLGDTIADINIKVDDTARASTRAFEKSRVASQNFFADQDMQLVQRQNRLAAVQRELDVALATPMHVGARSRLGQRAGFNVVGLDVAEERSFRRQLAEIDDLRAAEERRYATKTANLQSMTNRVAQMEEQEKDRHQDQLVAIAKQEADAYAQRFSRLKEHWDRVIELETKSQEQLVKAVEQMRQAQFAALAAGLEELGRGAEAARVVAQASYEKAAADRNEAMLKINEAVRTGQLDEERAAQMRVTINEEASAKIVELRVKELQAARKILDSAASAEQGALSKVTGAPTLFQGFKVAGALQQQVGGVLSGIQQAQDLGVLSPAEAADAAKRYAAAFGQAIDAAKIQFLPKSFAQQGEPAVVRLLDALKTSLKGGLDAAAQSSGIFGQKLSALKSDVDALNASVAAGTSEWQAVIDQFATRIPVAAAMAQQSLAALRQEIVDLSQQAQNLKASFDAVTGAKPASSSGAEVSASRQRVASGSAPSTSPDANTFDRGGTYYGPTAAGSPLIGLPNTGVLEAPFPPSGADIEEF